MSRKKIVQQRMQQLHITQKQIAQHIMLSADVINSWINGQVEIPYNYVWKVCELLSLDPDDLLEVV